MKRYLITGGTGMVGSHLVNEIKQTDAHITILTRQDKTSNHPKITYINWSKEGWQHQVPDIDIVINLAGATLNKRWTSSHKQAMMLSRIQSTQTLFELFETREHKQEKREQKNQKLMKEKKLDKTVQILKKAQMKKINRQHNKSHNKINLTSHQRIVKVPKINQIKHSQPDHKTMEIVAIKMLVRGRTHKNKIITIKILKAQKRINKK